MKRKFTLVMALVLMTALLAACGGSKPGDVYSKKEAAPEAPVHLKIGQLPIVDGLPFWVAEKNGYYKQQNVTVELITFKSALERDAALEGGQIDGTLTDITGAVTMYEKGTKLQIASLALGATKDEGAFAILAAPNSGITSVEQLKGVDIGISTNSVIHYVTDKLLLENGFKPEEIKVTNIPQIPVRFEALMSGQIKAATLPEPLLSLAVAKGAKVILDDTKAKQNYSHSVIVFTDKAIQEKGQGIKRFFIAYNLAVLDIRDKAEDYRDLLAEKAKLPAEIKNSFPVVRFSPSQAPQKADVEAVVQWLLEKKIIATKVEYEQLVNKTLYPQVK
ncbi:MAG: MetQ/NlpA family ABC transporter substrate-binding protein [Bacillota bacterium]